MKPTKKQVKKFWEYFGFRWDKSSYCFFAPGGQPYSASELNNLEDVQYLGLLFKYAVPEIWSLHWITFDQAGVIIEQHDTAESDAIRSQGRGGTPALDLFWAIWKVVVND